MSLPSMFAICAPREDVLKGAIAESDFAADLAQVLKGEAPEEYINPVKFFANTHPTRGLRNLLLNVCHRLSGSAEQVASIFRLDTNYGGGKTHSLIALAHAARGMSGVPNVGEFINPALLPTAGVRIAAFDGENADPANGRPLADGLRAYTPWGEIAYALGEHAGYELIRKSDETGVAPGSETIKELFGTAPTLILIDELSVYLRKLGGADRKRAGGQLTAFMTSLFKAVESSPHAALVYTLAIGKDKKAVDAYSAENLEIAEIMEEVESVSARKAALLDPTEEDETVKVLRRRLFASIDDVQAARIIDQYRQLWTTHKEHLPLGGSMDTRLEAFKAGYPLHPELIETLKEKTSTLGTFQRVRGMLRILARVVGQLWRDQPQDAFAVHLHHIHPGHGPIRQEIVTKLGQSIYVPALGADIAAVDGNQLSLAQEFDRDVYGGLAPYGSYVARTIFLHTLAFHENLKGLTSHELRLSILSPGTDISFIDDAVRRFIQSSAYLDDRPNAPLRFLAEANLTQMIRRQEKNVDRGQLRADLNDRIRSIFSGDTFKAVPFPSIPNDLPDESGERPLLAIINYDADDVAGESVTLPPLVRELFHKKSSHGDKRINLNNLVFVVVDAAKKEDMKNAMARRMALDILRHPEKIKDLAEHQQERLRELYRKSEQELAVSIQQAYRHLFYPTRSRVDGADVDLGHTVISVDNASADPGAGQNQVRRELRGINKLRLTGDTPDSPVYIRSKTPLRNGSMTTAALREEYRRDPSLAMLLGDQVFVRGILQGIEQGEFVYRSGELVCGQGDPYPSIKIDEQSFVLTSAYAREHDIWPPKPPEPKPEIPKKPIDEPPSGEGDDNVVPDNPGDGIDKPIKPTSPPDTTIRVEDVLKAALSRVWETARGRKYQRIVSIRLKIFEATDGFKLLGLINAIPKADKTVSIQGDYATANGSELSFEFQGSPQDAQPVKDFLDPQLRAATEKSVDLTFDVTFEDGLSLSGDEPEKLADRLTKFGTGAVFVEAVAQGAA
ncbi:MAG: ATP-binding protein [Proteobacteria bacterium]|nr:ATP-binding protein [Pseudomonadota bacterium]